MGLKIIRAFSCFGLKLVPGVPMSHEGCHSSSSSFKEGAAENKPRPKSNLKIKRVLFLV